MPTRLPIELLKEAWNTVASRREIRLKDGDKFQYLKNKDLTNLFKYSYESNPKTRAKKEKNFRKHLNNILGDQAKSILLRQRFTDDILDLARNYDLLEKKYKLDQKDFRPLKCSPAINAWECRLKLLSLSSKLMSKRTLDVSYLQKEFDSKVVTVMNHHQLEFFWYESIVNLLLTGVWWLPRHTSIIHIKLDDPNGSPTIFLEISNLTSMKEIECRWSEIDELRLELSPRLKGRRRVRSAQSWEFALKNKEERQEFIDEQNEKKGKTSKTWQKLSRKMRQGLNRIEKDQSRLEFLKIEPRWVKKQENVAGLFPVKFSEVYFF